MTASVFRPGTSEVRSKKICRLLEQQFGLEPVANTRAALDESTRERIVQTAAVLAQLEKTGTSLEATDYTLTRQGATLTLRRRHDDSIALKAYQRQAETLAGKRGRLNAGGVRLVGGNEPSASSRQHWF